MVSTESHVCILVVGQQEQNHGSINIRTRDNKVLGEFPLNEVLQRFKELAERRTNHAEDEFAGGSSKDGNVARATTQLDDTHLSEEQANDDNKE